MNYLRSSFRIAPAWRFQNRSRFRRSNYTFYSCPFPDEAPPPARHYILPVDVPNPELNRNGSARNPEKAVCMAYNARKRTLAVGTRGGYVRSPFEGSGSTR